jgi:hypothetical protein
VELLPESIFSPRKDPKRQNQTGVIYSPPTTPSVLFWKNENFHYFFGRFFSAPHTHRCLSLAAWQKYMLACFLTSSTFDYIPLSNFFCGYKTATSYSAILLSFFFPMTHTHSKPIQIAVVNKCASKQPKSLIWNEGQGQHTFLSMSQLTAQFSLYQFYFSKL